MDALVEILRWTQNVAFIAVALWSFARWRRFGTDASAWVAVTFGSLGLVVTTTVIVEDVLGRPLPDALTSVVISLIVIYPWLLLRFHDTFEPVPVWIRRVVGGVAALLVLASFTIDFPDPAQNEPQTPQSIAFTVLVVLHWLGTLPYVATRFWRAGRQQPTPARRRLQLLAIGAVAIAVSILLLATETGGNAETDPNPVVALATQIAPLIAAGSFLFGLAPPRSLRTLWRQPEEERIGEASLKLLEAQTAEEVASVVAPLMRHVVAADRVVLRHGGVTLAQTGNDDAAAAGREPIRIEIAGGSARIWPSRYMPFFGADELVVLGRIGQLADLALGRTSVLASERAARAELEAVNAELEAFVYSASHDLKSPTIAILSYIEIIEEEYGELLDEQGRYYLKRMRSNGSYMEALVRDLLELSRVGRRDTAPERVDLSVLLDQVGADIGDEQVDLVVGDVPVLHVNELRVRQLFQNLVGNAVKHADRERVRIQIEQADASSRGTTVLVRDDGRGVPPEYRERVFGVFEQLEADEDRDGTGMGLAICRKIMESFGGTIHLTDHDAGAEFALWFPSTALAQHATDATPQGALT